MISTILRGYIYDMGISLFFDNLKTNLFADKQKISMVGVSVEVYDSEENLLWCGEIVSETDTHMTIYDDSEGRNMEFPFEGKGDLIYVYDADEVSDDELVNWLGDKAE